MAQTRSRATHAAGTNKVRTTKQRTSTARTITTTKTKIDPKSRKVVKTTEERVDVRKWFSKKRKRASEDDDDEYTPVLDSNDKDSDNDDDDPPALANSCLPQSSDRQLRKRRMTNNSAQTWELIDDITVVTVPDTSHIAIGTLVTLKLSKSPVKAEPAIDPETGDAVINTNQSAPKKRSPYKFPKGTKFDNSYRFQWGATPIANFPIPGRDEFYEVFNVMQADLATHHNITVTCDPGVDINGPMHAANSVTVDAIVRIVLSQATDNTNALRVQQRLLETYPYNVRGKEVVGKIPNYHTIRQDTKDNLAAVLKPGGLHESRASFIKKMLDDIFNTNKDRLETLEGVELGNEKDAADFVPGLLSVDFLQGKSKNEIFNWYLKYDGVGVKSASCLMAFNYRLPVMAVDTHVFRLAKWLEWVPADCTEIQAAMHLDVIVPDELKLGLHQAFWHHGQRCVLCRARAPSKLDLKNGFRECPVESKMTRIRERKGTHPKSGSKATKKGSPKTMADLVKWEKMTPEVAKAKGYVEQIAALNDDFAAGSTNTGVLRSWVRASVSKVTQVQMVNVTEERIETMVEVCG